MPWLARWPVAVPENWVAAVNRPETEAELAVLRRSVARGRTVRWRGVAASNCVPAGPTISDAQPRPIEDRCHEMNLTPFFVIDPFFRNRSLVFDAVY